MYAPLLVRVYVIQLRFLSVNVHFDTLCAIYGLIDTEAADFAKNYVYMNVLININSLYSFSLSLSLSLSLQARNLIQQGKSRGQVTLVVATRGHVPSLSGSGSVGMGVGEWGGEKGTGSAGGPTLTMSAVDSRNKIKEIPDGVVLRKKKKSKNFHMNFARGD